MKAILLAAGRGTRISRFIGDQPKCVLDIGGIPLIRYIVDFLQSNNIEACVVLGYKKESVIKALEGCSVKYFYNPFFDVTNSLASLWFARQELFGDDLIIANADVYWEQDILNRIFQDEQDQVMLMDTSRNQDFLFKCEGKSLVGYGKEIQDYDGEYVGLAKIAKPFLSQFSGRLQALIDQQQHGLWWENVLYSFIGNLTVNVHDVAGCFWSEIDFIEDYYRITDHIAKGTAIRDNNILGPFGE